jgi:hypothetical protein
VCPGPPGGPHFGWPLGPLRLRPFRSDLFVQPWRGSPLQKGALGPVSRAPFHGCAAIFALLSFSHALLDGASLAVIRSGQGDAWGCDGFRWSWTSLWVSSGCWGHRSPIGSLVGVGEVCGLLADGHHYCKTFGGKPRSASALGRGRSPVSSSLGAHALDVGACFAGPFAAGRKVPGGTQWGQKDDAWENLS